MSRQLVAHPEEAVCDMLHMAVLKAVRQLNRSPAISSARNIEEASACMLSVGADALDLVVVSSTMPEDETDSVGSSGVEPTKRFVRALRALRPELPLIVVASTPDDRLAGFLDAFEPSDLITIGPDLAATLVERIQRLLTRPTRPIAPATRAVSAPAPTDGRVQLDIHLGGDQYGFWQMRRTGHGECEASGMLQLDSDLVDKVVRHSKRLNEKVTDPEAKWLEDLDDLSGELRELLFRKAERNIQCWERFLTQREQVGGVAQSRVRITVNDQTHPMLIEALRDSGHKSHESWVLNAPVFRRYATQLAFPPLFHDAASRTGPIRCLVIEADGSPSETRTGQWADLPVLRNLPAEARAVSELLQAAGCSVVRLSPEEHRGRPDAVVARLAERQWHMVHFCGHGVDTGSSVGLVLRAADDGLLSVERLTTALDKTQLLFLNSCRSAATRIVMQAVEQSVAALVGFQWVIEDRAALEFATDFYRALFTPTADQGRDLEQALLDARKKAYRRRPEHPSWMAPVLVMQMS